MADLRLQEFQVTEDGRPRKIALFEEVIARKRSQRPHNAGVYTNYVDDEAARRLTIILLDLLNTPYLSQQYARQELLKIISAGLNDDDPKALFALTRSGIVVLHDFTTDPAVLAAALHKVRGDPATPAGVDANSLALEVARLNSFGGPVDAGWDMVRQRWSIDKTLESLRDLANAFAGLPGRKALIWASAGFPFLWNAMPVQPFRRPARSGSYPVTPPISSYEKTYQLFHSANIAIYSIDVRGLPVDEAAYRDVAVAGNGVDYLRWAKQFREANTTTLVNFAEETGGKAFVGFSNVAEAFRQALDDARSYYLLGYYLDRANTKPGWHKLRVKIARSGAVVRARAGFLVPESSGAVQTDEIELALTSPLNYTAVPMALRVEPATDAHGKKHVEFTLTLPPGGFTIDSANDNHAWLEVSAGVVDAKGVVKATKPQTLNLHFKPESVAKISADGLVYRNFFDVDPGEYIGRIVVRDRLSGRIGSVSAPLQALP